MVYVLQKVSTPQSPATKKIIRSYKKEFATQLLKNATQTKSFNVLTYKNDTKLSTECWALKTKQLHPKVHGKSKEDVIPTIPFPKDVTCNLKTF